MPAVDSPSTTTSTATTRTASSAARIDQYYTRRLGGFDKVVFRLAGQYFNGTGDQSRQHRAVPADLRSVPRPRHDRMSSMVDSGFAGETDGANFNNPGTCDTVFRPLHRAGREYRQHLQRRFRLRQRPHPGGDPTI